MKRKGYNTERIELRNDFELIRSDNTKTGRRTSMIEKVDGDKVYSIQWLTAKNEENEEALVELNLEKLEQSINNNSKRYLE